MSDFDTLKPKQRAFVKALLTCKDTRAAAAACGVSESSAWRWLREDAVKAALYELESEAMSELSRGLLTLAKDALETLKDALDADKDSDRLKAVDIILSKLLALRELASIENQLSRLEGGISESEYTTAI